MFNETLSNSVLNTSKLLGSALRIYVSRNYADNISLNFFLLLGGRNGNAVLFCQTDSTKRSPTTLTQG